MTTPEGAAPPTALGKATRLVKNAQTVGNLNGVWSILLRVGLVLFPIAGGAVIKNAIDIAAIKANRFTSADGLDVWREMSEIKREMASIPREVPPPWLVSRLDRLEDRMDSIDEKLAKIPKS